MKILFAIIILLIGCSPVKHEHFSATNSVVLDGSARSVKTIYIDGCEYVVIGSWHSGMMAHKGDCQGCKNRLLEESEDAEE